MIKRCRLSKKIQDQLVEYFILQVTARSAADMLGIQANSAALFYHKLRLIICEVLKKESDNIFSGEIEADESYFGGVRKDKRGRGASGKVPVFGLLKRGGKVYTQVLSDTKSDTLMPIIVKKAKKVTGIDIYGALGGFHLFRKTPSKIWKTVNALKAVGIQKVSPCHCTGQEGCRIFKEAFSENYTTSGVGAKFEF